MPGHPCCCNSVPTVNCSPSHCAGGVLPGQAILTLPAMSDSGAGKFSHAGGDFLIDPYSGSKPVQTGPFGSPWGCVYMGAVLGTRCGESVVPVAGYYATSTTVLAGYAVETASYWYVYWARILSGSLDCIAGSKTFYEEGDDQPTEDCDGSNDTPTGFVNGECTLELRSA